VGGGSGSVGGHISPDRFKVAKAGQLEEFKWIASNLRNREVMPEDAPSAYAYYRLKQVQVGDQHQVKFWDVYDNMMKPTLAELKNQAQFDDDERDLERLCEAVIAAGAVTADG
jgi:hypothetical protein